MTFLAACLRRYPYGTSARISLFMAPAFCLLIAEGMVAVLRARGRVKRGTVITALILAIVPACFIIIDIRMPYSRQNDLAYRRFARELADQAAPGDRWIVFDGAEPLPQDPDLMISVWIQRVARLRFYLLCYGREMMSFQPDPADVKPITTGKTWLILHDHGYRRLYPKARRAEFEAAIAGRLGRSKTFRRELPIGSTVDVSVFEGSDPTAPDTSIP